MDLFKQMNLNLNEYETENLLHHIKTNKKFARNLKNALLMEDSLKVEQLLRNRGIR